MSHVYANATVHSLATASIVQHGIHSRLQKDLCDLQRCRSLATCQKCNLIQLGLSYLDYPSSLKLHSSSTDAQTALPG